MRLYRRKYSTYIVAALFVTGVFFSFAATTTPRKRFLVLAEFDQQAATNHMVHLVRIPFTDGVPGPREKIMDVITQQESDKTPRIRFDLGRNQVYRNRYIITGYGQVVDIVAKKVLVDTHDQLVKVSGDSIIFYTNDIFRGQYYSVLDLNSGTFAQVKNSAFNPLPGNDVEPDCSQRNFKIWYYPPSKPKVEVIKDAGYGEDVSLIPNGKPRLPIHWIDPVNFVYPHYNSTQDVATIYKVNYITHEQIRLGSIDRLPENRCYTEFLSDPDGNLLYYCARGYYRIDLKKNSIEELSFFRVGFGFEIGIQEIPGKGNEIKHKGQSIGHYFCSPSLAVAAEGSIAFPYEMAIENEHYLQGAAYWTNETGKWRTAGDSDLASVVGWTEE